MSDKFPFYSPDKEQQFLDGLADLCNTYGYLIRGGKVSVHLIREKPMTYALNRMTGDLLYNRIL